MHGVRYLAVGWRHWPRSAGIGGHRRETQFMNTESDDKPASCNDCVHYFITHDADFIYGCRAFGFKSQRQPIFEVVAASGQDCEGFQKKECVPK
jgi:hypothetical protein